MLENGSAYVYGSTAEKIKYDVYSENKVLKAKRKQRSHNKAKLKACAAILFVFGLCFLVIFRYALITEMNYKIIKANKELTDLKNQNIRLKVEIDKNTDLTKIREFAEKRMGMQKPDHWQIVKVNVPKNDFTKVSYMDKQADPMGGTGTVLVEKVSRLVQFLY